MNSYYVLDRASNGQWFWVLRGPNHEPICVSETYATRQGALNGIQATQRCSGTAAIQDKTTSNAVAVSIALTLLGTTAGYYVVDRAKNRQFFWTLRAPNHETIGVSETYVTHQGAMRGIEANRRHGSTTHIVDVTIARSA